ncbi:MAG: competence/damage-inducible protein A [Blastocatellia bacterium]|nr:competence/damage-inducible protein A [Blastocatellia bacterium]
MNAEIIAIGSELLTPDRIDTNSLWLTEKLNAIGIEVRLKTIVGDDDLRLEEAVRDAVRRSEVVISTGGLGPTEDDITRKVFARVLGRPLVLDDAILDDIRRKFARIGAPMTSNNERQALVLRDAEVLSNPRGTAPGLLIQHDRALIVLLPGPPREMQPMFSELILPRLEKLSHGIRICKRVMKTTGLGESALDQKIAPIYGQYSNPATTILAKPGEVEIHLTAKSDTTEAAVALLDELAEKIEDELFPSIYSHRGESLEEVVGLGLTVKGYTIATAESCTGGLIAKRITDVPGSSEYFLEGLVTYSNGAKTRLLGVPQELIAEHGAVSAEVAEAMATGVKAVSGATIGVSTTGIAGPGGGTEQKPVGLVFIAIADDVQVEAKPYTLFGSRQEIRERASQIALDLIRRRFLL